MEFYPDDRYRHDNKHNKCNTNANSNLECMKLENLLVCPKCHCVVLMKSEKMEYVYCHKCHGNTLMVPLVYVIAIYQNPMNFPMACTMFPPNMVPFMTFPPMGPQGGLTPMVGGPGPVIIQPAGSPQTVNQGMSNVNYGPWSAGYPMGGIGPEVYPLPPMMPPPTNNVPFSPNIDPKQTNNGYVNNAYIPNNNYMNPFWSNLTPVDPNNYNNPNNYNDPNGTNPNKDPNKDNKIKTPISTKRASELFD